MVAKKGEAAQGQGLLQVKAGPTHIMASPSPLYDTSGLPLRGGTPCQGCHTQALWADCRKGWYYPQILLPFTLQMKKRSLQEVKQPGGGGGDHMGEFKAGSQCSLTLSHAWSPAPQEAGFTVPVLQMGTWWPRESNQRFEPISINSKVSRCSIYI